MNPIDKIIFAEVEVNYHSCASEGYEFEADVRVEFNNKEYVLCYQYCGYGWNKALILNSRESGDDYYQLKADVIAEYCEIEDWDVSDMYQEINDKFIEYAENAIDNAIEDFNTDSE